MSWYGDIINLPHHVSPTRQRMSMHDRAAQFAPFAALVGYDDAVAEVARVTEKRPELDEQEKQELNAKLSELAEHIQDFPSVRIKYFIQDERKAGGAVVEACGTVKKLVADDKTIVLTDGTAILIPDLLGIELNR